MFTKNNMMIGGAGIVLGILITVSGFSLGRAFNDYDRDGSRNFKNNQASYRGELMHRMSDGSMMNNENGMGGMNGMMMDMTSRMQGKTGDALDKVFLEDMIVHHQGAVDMAKILKAGTQRPELQKMADDIISVQTKEIDMMKNWQTTWFPATTTVK